MEGDDESARIVHETNGLIYEAVRAQMNRYNHDAVAAGHAPDAVLIPPAWEDLEPRFQIAFGLAVNREVSRMADILSNIAATLIAAPTTIN